jgi:hypothetical protein
VRFLNKTEDEHETNNEENSNHDIFPEASETIISVEFELSRTQIFRFTDPKAELPTALSSQFLRTKHYLHNPVCQRGNSFTGIGRSNWRSISALTLVSSVSEWLNMLRKKA